MSKILVIPDVHLKPWMFDKADEIPTSKYDSIICLGDLVDDWGQENNESLYRETLERVLKFDKDHPDMRWCIGNHDISYRYYLMESGFSLHMAPLVNSYLDRLEDQAQNRVAIIHNEGLWLFTHAGLTDEWCFRAVDTKDINDIIDEVNEMVNRTDDVKNRLWNDLSPIWFRWQEDFGNSAYGVSELYLENVATGAPLHQCTGHTPTKKPFEGFMLDPEKPIALSLDTFSTFRSGRPVGDQRFVIINTLDSTWQYAN